MTTNQRHRLIRQRVTNVRRGPGYWYRLTLSCGHQVDQHLPFCNIPDIVTCYDCSLAASVDDEEAYGEE
jgi:hypothetical protein